MSAKIGQHFLCMLALAGNLAGARRVSTRSTVIDGTEVDVAANQEASINATSRNLPPEVMQAQQKMLITECALKYANGFFQLVSGDQYAGTKTSGTGRPGLKRQAPGLKLEGWKMKAIQAAKEAVTHKFHNTSKFEKMRGVDKSSNPFVDDLTVHREDGIDGSEYPSCTVGSPLEACIEEMPLGMWVQQRWALEDVLEAHKKKWYRVLGIGAERDTGFDRARVAMKAAIYKEAVKATGFSASKARDYCKSQADEPEVDAVRSCVRGEIQSQPDLLPLMEAQWHFEDRLIVLEEMINWGLTAQIVPKFFGGQRLEKAQHVAIEDEGYDLKTFKKQATEQLEDAKEQIKEYQKGQGHPAGMWDKIKSWKKNSVYDDCKKLQKSKTSKDSMIRRAMGEVIGKCDADKDCTEISGSYCPVGYACDCQRAFTPDRQKKALVYGTVIGIPLVWGIGGAVGFFTSGPAGVVAGAQTAAVLVPDPVPGILAAAVFTKKFFPECMCFMQKCVYKGGHCAMESTSSMASSSNPTFGLPSDGMKCVPMGSDKTNCELLQCGIGDARHDGPQPFLKGRVGLDDGGVFNCANTQGTLSSLLTNLEKLPSPEGTHDAVDNNPENRASLLHLWPSNWQ